MGMIYEQAPEEVGAIIARVMKDHHIQLVSAGVTISALFASNEKGECAVKLHGWPCAATIKKTTLERRARGAADAELTIDKVTWDDATEDEHDALIDHELTHLEPLELGRSQGTGQMLYDTDNLGRPKLKLRLHDAEFGAFNEIIKRHGRNAPEAKVVIKYLQDRTGQLLMEWADGKAK